MQVGDVMKSAVKTTTPDQTFAHVAKLLKDNAISSVVVMDGDRLAGIVTERDLVNLVADGLDPQAQKAADPRSTHRDTAQPRTDIAAAAEHMPRPPTRKLPLLDKGALVGI